jgi:hypothetical protein
MRRPVLQMAVVAGLSVHALAPASAADTCDQWRVPVDWQIYQDNGYRLFFKFDRNQEHGIRGSVEGHHGTNLRGLFEGHINPEKRKIVFTIRWSNGSVGGYDGTISRQGIVEGFTYDKNSKGSNAGFRAESMLNCAKWVSTTPSSPAPQSPSGPGSKPDATKNQQGSSTPPDVLTPEKSAGPSPFGDREVTPQKPFDPDPSNVDLTSKPGGIKKAPRAGTNFGGGGGGDPR